MFHMGGPCDGGASTNIRSRIVRNIHMRCHCTPERPWRNVISRLLPCAAQHISVRGLRLTKSHAFEQFYHLAFACGRGRFASKRTAPVGLQTFTAAGRGGAGRMLMPHSSGAAYSSQFSPGARHRTRSLMWRPGARVRPSAMICPSAAPREANAGPHEAKTEPHEANAAPRKPGPGSHEPSPEPHENSRAAPKRRTFSFLR